MTDPGYITTAQLKRDMADVLTRMFTTALQGNSIDDETFILLMSEIEEIDSMADDHFYAWFNSIRETGLLK